MKAVAVSLYGGLGNQLFQYATGLALAQQNQAKLFLDLSWFELVKASRKVTPRHYALSPFEIEYETLPFLRRGFYFKFAHHFSLPIKNPLGMPICFEKHYHFDNTLEQLDLPIHIDGYWQSYRYFESIKPLLRNQIAQARNLDITNKAMLKEIQSFDSVCVHVRRGDYVTNPSASQHHGTCTVSYYNQAIMQTISRMPSSRFFIFSDDIAWTKANLTIPNEHVFVNINSHQDAHLDLWLMTACRDFIIANSSLSWWAAWLSQHTDKHVIVPSQWFANAQIDTKDLIPNSWQKLSVN